MVDFERTRDEQTTRIQEDALDEARLADQTLSVEDVVAEPRVLVFPNSLGAFVIEPLAIKGPDSDYWDQPGMAGA